MRSRGWMRAEARQYELAYIRDAVFDDMRKDADTTGRQRSTHVRNRSVHKISEMVTSAVQRTATAISAANGATSSARAGGACRETSVAAKASRFDRRKGHRSAQEIRSTAFRRRSWLTRLLPAGKR